ncbi:NUDIX hydrolase [Pseudofrankia sp. BMG5.37]|uniref:NUDIX hydrolase n=1 Tax=Pseudofrankia sp. BMG5.37 TaxID=3050035 RepID=UPI0028952D10|nr:NUDIX hydrolase [Pseudofrankia sp. BMG5.37]MDT3441752.1 NUDIX hydrolase [Pseudofrankia sp. BMG5.37]
MPLSSPRGVMAANAGTPAPLRHASTVVLLRDTPGGPEAYLVRRARTMAFAGGVFAFPGGRVDPADSGFEVPWAGQPMAEVMSTLEPDAALARALVHAAVRETFEECGVLLAGPAAAGGAEQTGASATRPAPLDPAGPAWAADRVAMERRELTLAGLLARHGLALRANLLAPWARWITPEVEPRRYDTRFFMAALPPGQLPGELSGEADRMLWTHPADALERHAAGRMAMLPPTAWMLSDLLGFASVAEVLAAAAGRTITPVMPKIVIFDDAVHFLLPHDPEYATAGPPADPVNASAIIAAATIGASGGEDGPPATAAGRERP